MVTKQRRTGLHTSATAAGILLVTIALAGGVLRTTAASAETSATGAASSPTLPDAYKLNMMIRTTLIALNQANQTGNYSVLRDLGTPQFQSLNSDARLAEIFAALRNRNLDLSPLLFFDPKLLREPALQSGLLRLTGYIPTDPERILFDIGFERVGDQWRLSAIVIDVQPLKEPPASPSKAKEPQAKSTPKNKAKAATAPPPAAPP
jgi:hypothetical protein